MFQDRQSIVIIFLYVLFLFNLFYKTESTHFLKMILLFSNKRKVVLQNLTRLYQPQINVGKQRNLNWNTALLLILSMGSPHRTADSGATNKKRIAQYYIKAHARTLHAFNKYSRRNFSAFMYVLLDCTQTVDTLLCIYRKKQSKMAQNKMKRT